MSTRFGRNQRRRMREALALETAENERQQRRVEDYRQQLHTREQDLRSVERIFDEARDMVGRASALFRPERMRIEHADKPEPFRVIVAAPMPDVTDPNAAWEPPHDVELDVLLAQVEYRSYQDALHCYASFGRSDRVCYAMSGHAAATMRPERMVRLVAENLAHQLVPLIIKRSRK